MNPSSASKPTDSRRRERLLLLVILAATVAAYSPALSFQFVYDDFPQIVHNKLIQSWQYAGLYPRIHVWAQTSNWGNYYRPLFLFLLLLEHTAFGLHPMGWHAVSIAFHLANTLLVFALAREFLDEQSALVSAMIFALHPIHIESVVWVSGITDPLLAAFSLLCILSFIRFRKRGEYSSLFLSLLFCAGALLTKETAIILPGLLAAYELFYAPKEPATAPPLKTRRRNPKRLLPLLPFVALALAYSVVRYRVLGAFSKVVIPLEWHVVALTWPAVILKYLRLLIAPYPLSLFYDVPYVLHPGWENFWLPCLLLLLIGAALGVLMLRWGPLARFAVALLVLPILPPLDLPLLPRNEVVHDRYLYLPSVGLALLAGLAWQRIKAAPALTQRAVPWRAALIVSLAFALATLTAVQSLPWVNNLVLYADSVKHAPGLPVVHNNMGNEFTERGMYADAIDQYQQALKILPDYWYSLFNLGAVYYKSGRYEEAAAMLDRALHINPQDSDSWYYAGLTQEKLGHLDEAEHDLGIAVQIWPAKADYRGALDEVRRQKSARKEPKP